MTDKMPAIPVITDPELLLAVRSLGNAALSFKQAFMIMLSISDKNETINDFINRQAEFLELQESVVDHWANQLDLDTDIES